MPSDSVLKVIELQPGFNKNTTHYRAENYWVDGDKVRFRNGTAEKIGGWVRESVSQATDATNTSFTGTARNIHAWTDLRGDKYFAVGTEQKVELFAGSQIYDITPYREELTLTDAITTTNGSSIVSILDVNHNLLAGDYVFVDAQATPVDGITLSGEYRVLAVIDLDNYTLQTTTTASGSTSGGGGALQINYLLEVGDVSNGNITGYGGGTYGTPGSASISTISLTNAVTTNGTTTIRITDTAHGRVVGGEVTVVSQASAVDGVSLLGDYEVVSVVDVDHYTIIHSTAATGSTTDSGGALVVQYGGEGWNRPRGGVGGANLRQWSADNWGEDFVTCVREGKIYHWDATNGPGTRLQQIANAPVRNLKILVAQPSRHLVAFGTESVIDDIFDPLLIRWAEQETLTGWAITTTNTAGEYRLPLGNYIVDVIQTKNEVLILTDNTVYSMRYVGGTSIFQFDILANNISAVSSHCGLDVDGTVYWMGVNCFYRYDGVVRVLKSSLEEFYYDQDAGGRLNFNQKEKTFCAANKEFNEIIWLVPVDGNDEITRYILHNYIEGTWYDGTIDRTVWLDRSIYEKPYALSSTGTLYIHEEGKDDDAQPMLAYLVSGDIDLGEGQEILFLDRFIPDFKLIPNRSADLYLYLKRYPNATATVKGPYTFNNDTNKINLRARGRHMSFKYEVNTLGSDFEVGYPRFGLQADGER